MSNFIAVDREALDNIVASLESGMIQPLSIGRDLRRIVDAAPKAYTVDLVGEMRQEIESYGSGCRCKKGYKCRRCRVLDGSR